MTRKTNALHPLPAGCLVLLFLLAAATVTGGCVKYLPGMTPEVSPGVSNLSLTGTGAGQLANDTPVPEETAPVVRMTPARSEIVVNATPILTPDPYPIQHGTRLNETRQYSFLDRQPEFVRKFVLRGNATAMIVNVAEGPLYIVYMIDPQNDCTKDPDTCRGDVSKEYATSVQRPWLTITVRDNRTHEIVAQDGYGGIYSSDIGHYKFEVKRTNADGSTSNEEYYPGPRYIPIYRDGAFHITLEGNFLDVGLAVITGASPDPLESSTEPEKLDWEKELSIDNSDT
jgi:hypothetical protein